MLTDQQLNELEKKLLDAMVHRSDSGGMTTIEVADFAVRSLHRMVYEYRELIKLAKTIADGRHQPVPALMVENNPTYRQESREAVGALLTHC